MSVNVWGIGVAVIVLQRLFSDVCSELVHSIITTVVGVSGGKSKSRHRCLSTGFVLTHTEGYVISKGAVLDINDTRVWELL